jgi:membrane protease YdiL (CAAX protease family)
MSTPAVAPPARDLRARQAREVDRYERIRQYSLRDIVAIWAAATVSMAVLAWIVTPWLGDRLGGSEPIGEGLLICFNAGLIWMLVLTLILVRQEQGSLEWPRVRDALWLGAPKDPNTGRVGGELWRWVIPFTLLGAGLEMLPIDPDGPLQRDLPRFVTSDRGEHFFQGAWGWFGLAVLVMLLAPWVEELFFRGLMLPRMRAVFGKRDWVVNGAIFTAFHLHQPWSVPATLLDGIFAQAYPTKRFQSIWIAVAGHTLPSLFMIAVLLGLVVK